jgi:hypothetical protein
MSASMETMETSKNSSCILGLDNCARELIRCEDLTVDEYDTLSMRLRRRRSLNLLKEHSICKTHYKSFYEIFKVGTTCVNLWMTHETGKCPKGTHTISLQLARAVGGIIAPGENVCRFVEKYAF